MPEQYLKIENYKNGIVLGAVLGAAILWGDKLRDPLVKWLNSVIPSQVSFLGALWAPLVIIGVCALVGYLVDKF
jgi:uncharacterized protein involved in cysteine biosynthesis